MIRAKYTVVLKTLMDNEQTRPLLDKAMSSYPMYTPLNDFTYGLIPTREELNKKILNYYKYREIGFETVGRFLDELETSLNEIMPGYNQEYKALDVLNGVEDPFGNVDITESFEEETTGNSKGTSESKSNVNGESTTNTEMKDNSKSIKSTTPQDLLSIDTSNINSVNYADEVGFNENISNSKGSTTDKSDSTSSGSSTGESSGTTKHTLTRKGNQGVNTYAHDLKELKELLINIEQKIINDSRISELFMTIY